MFAYIIETDYGISMQDTLARLSLFTQPQSAQAVSS
jgi:hypothetical protein